MKVYISSDIEGTAGIANWEETELGKGEWNQYFREEMSKESAACARAAFDGGADEVMIKDAHDEARNLIPSLFPKRAAFIRGWTGSPYTMVDGISEGYGAAAFTGYHAPATSPGSPLSHTMDPKARYVGLNGTSLSEFRLNALICASYGVKTIFASGDEAICEEAEVICPGIKTAPVNKGIGGASVSLHPKAAIELIYDRMLSAMGSIGKIPLIKLPSSFEMSIKYHKHQDAYKMGFFPGARLVNPHEVAFTGESLSSLLSFIHFAL